MDKNLMLYAASYSDPDAAKADLKAIKDAEGAADIAIIGAVVIKSDADGKINVTKDGSTVLEGAFLGGVTGVVIGVLAPPLLLATAVGAGLGAGIGGLVKRHQEKEIGIQVEDILPPNSSAVVVVAEDLYADKIDKALAKADKKITRAIDSDDYDKLVKALTDAGYDMSS